MRSKARLRPGDTYSGYDPSRLVSDRRSDALESLLELFIVNSEALLVNLLQLPNKGFFGDDRTGRKTLQPHLGQ